MKYVKIHAYIHKYLYLCMRRRRPERHCDREVARNLNGHIYLDMSLCLGKQQNTTLRFSPYLELSKEYTYVYIYIQTNYIDTPHNIYKFIET